MTNELILELEDNVIASAKLYAKQKGKSLSAIVETYLKTLNPVNSRDNRSSFVSKLKGSISLPMNFDYKK